MGRRNDVDEGQKGVYKAEVLQKGVLWVLTAID
jgi:hypothetical protein